MSREPESHFLNRGYQPGLMNGTSTSGLGKGLSRLSAKEKSASSNWKIRTQGSCTLGHSSEKTNHIRWNLLLIAAGLHFFPATWWFNPVVTFVLSVSILHKLLCRDCIKIT
jgi:hypothetical protein